MVLVEPFGSLCYGATLVLKQPNDPFAHLKCVDATLATPSLISACDPADYPDLVTIAVAGEPVPQGLADAWGDRDLWNLYGPAEVCAMFHFIMQDTSMDKSTSHELYVVCGFHASTYYGHHSDSEAALAVEMSTAADMCSVV